MWILLLASLLAFSVAHESGCGWGTRRCFSRDPTLGWQWDFLVGWAVPRKGFVLNSAASSMQVHLPDRSILGTWSVHIQAAVNARTAQRSKYPVLGSLQLSHNHLDSESCPTDGCWPLQDVCCHCPSIFLKVHWFIKQMQMKLRLQKCLWWQNM